MCPRFYWGFGWVRGKVYFEAIGWIWEISCGSLGKMFEQTWRWSFEGLVVVSGADCKVVGMGFARNISYKIYLYKPYTTE